MTARTAGVYALILSMTLFTIACSDSAPKESQQAAAPLDNNTEKQNKPASSGAGNGQDSGAQVKPPETKELEKPEKPVPSKEPAATTGTESDASKPSPTPPSSVASSTYQPKAAKPASANDRKAYSWYYMKKGKGKVPNFPGETKAYTEDMKALWVGTGKKVYLTIDTGGDLGDTKLLLKSLKDNDAKANFFIAGYNVKKAPDFVRQLVEDGHLVANHTMTHTDMNLQTDEQVKKEIQDYEKLYKEVTGKEIQPYFRFPYGRYNMHLLQMVSDMGYTSVFWSTAMRDWEPRKNGAEDPYNDIMNNLHDGNIILMHQGSKENIEALDRIIKGVREAGYEFALLTDIKPPAK